MNKREPVALWKGIVGTALSDTLLMVLTPAYLIYLNQAKAMMVNMSYVDISE